MEEEVFLWWNHFGACFFPLKIQQRNKIPSHLTLKNVLFFQFVCGIRWDLVDFFSSLVLEPMRSKHINSNVYGPCKVNTFQNEPAISFAHLMIWLATKFKLILLLLLNRLNMMAEKKRQQNVAWTCFHSTNCCTKQKTHFAWKRQSYAKIKLSHTENRNGSNNNDNDQHSMASNDTPSFYMIVDVTTLII